MDGNFYPTFDRDLAAQYARLVANGYEPVAVDGKRALGDNWSTRPNTIEAIAAERAALPNATNTGLRTGRLVGLDIDVVELDHAERVRALAIELLGCTLFERRGAKGLLLCYRTETPGAKITVNCAGKPIEATASKAEKQYAKPKVEILGTGQQFVAYGIHPDTGRPYQWCNDLGPCDPLSLPFSVLPIVTRAQLMEFARKAAELLNELGYGAGWLSLSGEEKAADPKATRASTGKRVSWEGLRRRLSYIHPAFDGARPACYPPPSQKRQEQPLDYSSKTWLGIGLTLRDADIPLLDDEPHDWLELADEWSCGDLWYERTGERLYDLNYPEQGVDVRLAGNKRQGGTPTTIASIVAYAKDGGCPLGADDEPTELDDCTFDDEPTDNADEGKLRLNSKTPYKSALYFLRSRYIEPDGTKRLIHYRDDFYAWTGTHYRAVPEEQLRAEMYPFLDAAYQGSRRFAPNPKKVNEVLHGLKARVFLSPYLEAPVWLPGNRDVEVFRLLYGDGNEMLACNNVLLHLPSLLQEPHTPQLLTFNALDFAYDPEAPEPAEWVKFLEALWPDDPEAIATLQEMFGYMLSGDLRQQKLFLLVGPKRAGKGTIARVLRMLLGVENVSGPTLASLGQPFGLEPLIGKRAAIVSDARLGGGADQNAIVERLLSISGEDAIQVPRKYKSAWEGKLGVRFLVLSNELPRFTDASGAIASRFLILTLNNSFYGREDQGLTDRLMRELPGILNWAVVGWQRLTSRGHFVTPKSSVASVEALEELSSPIKAFLNDRCVIEPTRTIARTELFWAWEMWCHTNGHQPGSSQNFGVRLRAAVPGLRDIRPRVEGKPVRTYLGIGIRAEGWAAAMGRSDPG
jgi:putative DNA primase/helicase